MWPRWTYYRGRFTRDVPGRLSSLSAGWRSLAFANVFANVSVVVREAPLEKLRTCYILL